MDITLIITYPISSNFSKKKVSPAITMFSALPYALLYNETRTDFCILCILLWFLVFFRLNGKVK